MPKPLQLDPRAEREIDEAYDWYQKIRSELAAEFEHEIKSALRAIQEYPGRAVPYLHGSYRVLLPKYPYYVVFYEYPDHLFVVAVPNNRRKPGYWLDRLR